MATDKSNSKHDKKLLTAYRHHMQDEIDAAFLYRRLAELEKDEKRKNIYTALAKVEDGHGAMLKSIIEKSGEKVNVSGPSARARFWAWFLAKFGDDYLLKMMLKEEGREVKSYLKLTKSGTDEASRQATRTIARESIGHAESLSVLAGKSSEPWHQTGTGGFLRDVIYGFNDGLTANFGLVAGVIGASVAPHFILVSGLAGAVADALSMGSSGYLAAKSEQDVNRYEIEMERQEIALMPELEEEEMALIYQAKGIEAGRAKAMARELMSDPDRALDAKVKEELGIGEPHTTPLKEGLVTGIATAVGAIIPVAPFFFLKGMTAIWLAFSLAMLSHFAVGAARSFFTGRGIFRSGIDMFVVGLGVAVTGYLVGDWIIRFF